MPGVTNEIERQAPPRGVTDRPFNGSDKSVYSPNVADWLIARSNRRTDRPPPNSGFTGGMFSNTRLWAALAVRSHWLRYFKNVTPHPSAFDHALMATMRTKHFGLGRAPVIYSYPPRKNENPMFSNLYYYIF